MQRKARAAGAAGIIAILAIGSSRGATASPTCPLPIFGPGADYHPQIVPKNFSPTVDNPYFPLSPGATLVYTGNKDGKKALDLFATTKKTAVIDGVTTRVVEDRLYLDNVLSERTRDYYAQDNCGNVWYFGEDTAELDGKGRVVNTDGSFRAGVGGAQPGVVMQAVPELGRQLRQEWSAGQAEDQYLVVKLKASVKVPYGSFRDALRTEETTSLEPDVVDNKYYVRGVGVVKEISVKGPREQLDLIEVIS